LSFPTTNAEISARPHAIFFRRHSYIEVEFKEATTFPIVVIGIEHDSPGKAMPKKTTNLGTGKG
jgi:hypothetical protein